MKISIPQKLRLNTLLYNKKFTVALSIILAFALWLGIAMTENPVRKRTFNNLTADITLTNVAGLDDLGIISDVSSQKFTVIVSGPNYIVSSLRADDFTLTADTSNIVSAGTQSVKIIPTCDKTGFDITVSPSTINVKVDKFDDISLELVPVLIGVSVNEEDDFVAETPVFADTKLPIVDKFTINGPLTTLEKIDLVRAEAVVNRTLKESETFNADIVLYRDKYKNDTDRDDLKFEDRYEEIYRYTSDGFIYDGNKNLINNSYLTLDFTSTKIYQEVLKEKTVDLKTIFTNAPADFPEKNIRLTPKQVTITGLPDKIDKIDDISLSTIDFRDVSINNNSFEIEVKHADVKTFEGSTDPFKVTVDISLYGYAETMITVSDIRDLDGNKISAESISVKVCGPLNVLRSIEESDFYALVDIADKGVGTHKEVKAVIKSDIKNVWQVGPQPTTTVKLS